MSEEASSSPDFQAIYDRMMLAGWMSASRRESRGASGGEAHHFEFTKQGIENMRILGHLLRQLHAPGLPLTGQEMESLRLLADLVLAQQDLWPPKPGEESPPPARI